MIAAKWPPVAFSKRTTILIPEGCFSITHFFPCHCRPLPTAARSSFLARVFQQCCCLFPNFRQSYLRRRPLEIEGCNCWWALTMKEVTKLFTLVCSSILKVQQRIGHFSKARLILFSFSYGDETTHCDLRIKPHLKEKDADLWSWNRSNQLQRENLHSAQYVNIMWIRVRFVVLLILLFFSVLRRLARR